MLRLVILHRPKATTEYDLHIFNPDIVIYSHLRNLVIIQLQRQLSEMKIDFALEPERYISYSASAYSSS